MIFFLRYKRVYRFPLFQIIEIQIVYTSASSPLLQAVLLSECLKPLPKRNLLIDIQPKYGEGAALQFVFVPFIRHEGFDNYVGSSDLRYRLITFPC